MHAWNFVSHILIHRLRLNVLCKFGYWIGGQLGNEQKLEVSGLLLSSEIALELVEQFAGCEQD